MTLTSRRLLAVPVVMLLLTVIAAPAAAEHVYSHRYDVYGRVTDADGVPLENVTVEPRGISEALPVSGLCAPHESRAFTDAWGVRETQPRTNALGEYAWCLHVHKIPRDADGAFRMAVGDVEVEGRVDPVTRTTVVDIVVPDVEGNGTAAYADAYTVSGRVLNVTGGARQVDDVRVYGDALVDEEVRVAYLAPGGDEVTNAVTRTNAFGQFAVRLDVTAVAEDARIVVEAAGGNAGGNANPVSRASDLPVLVSAAPTEDGSEDVGENAPTEPSPNGDQGTPGPGAVAALAALAVAVRVGTRRRG